MAAPFTPPRTARFDDGARALSEDEMRRAAPSIFAARPHASRSERFRAIPTIEVLQVLEQEGFVAVGVKQSAPRDASKTDYTKHMIRLRRLDNAEQHRVGDVVCEIMLRNANDGTTAYELMAIAPAATDRLGGWRRGRVVTTRAISNIDQDVRLNRALWVLGERMANSLGLAA